MPHIKTIRLANIHFNNATQFYDDFMMELGGKNTTYDLENGGGKSLLLQMLLQTVLPKAYLRREKPVSLIFQGGKDRVSHVAVEWLLDDDRQYKYLLTGFCARKKRGDNPGQGDSANGGDDEQNLQSGDIEHLNWFVFFNDHKTAGIHSAPLMREEAGRKIYASFDDMRKYIQQMKQKGLPAGIFDNISEYQSHIGPSNLIPAEWNIIKGINSGENSIESYFRQNTTSRKLIENQFIRIIEDVEAFNRGEKTNEESLLLADTLIEIRSRLSEYLKLKGHMSEYEKIRGYYGEFADSNDVLLASYKEFEALKVQASAYRNLINAKLKGLEDNKSELLEKIENNRKRCEAGATRNKQLEAGAVLHGIKALREEKDINEAERKRLDENYVNCRSKYFEAKALEGYGMYRRIKERLNQDEQSLKTLESDGDALNGQYRAAGGKLKYMLEKELKNSRQQLDKLSEEIFQLEGKQAQNNDQMMAEEKHISALQTEEKHLAEDEKSIGKEIEAINQYFLSHGEMDALMDPKNYLEKTREQRGELEAKRAKAEEQIKNIGESVQDLNIKAEAIKGDIRLKESAKKQDDEWLKLYEKERAGHLKNASALGKDSLEAYRDELAFLVHRENRKKLELEIESGRLKQKKQLSEERGYYVPNEDIVNLAGKLSGKCEYVKEGIDWLSVLTPDEKESLLNEMPFLPFSVVIDGKSFEKLLQNRIRMDFETDYPVPVVNIDTIRSGRNPSKADIFYYCGFNDLIKNPESYTRYIESMDMRISGIANEIAACELRAREQSDSLSKLAVFMENYSASRVLEVTERVNTTETEIRRFKDSRDKCEKEKENFKQQKREIEKAIGELSESIVLCMEKENKLETCIRNSDEQTRIRAELSSIKKEIEGVDKVLRELRAEASELKQQAGKKKNDSFSLGGIIRDLERESEAVASFNTENCDDRLEDLRGNFAALKERVSGRTFDEESLRRNIEDYRQELKNYQENVLNDYDRDLEQIAIEEEKGVLILIPSKEQVRTAKNELNEAEASLKSSEKMLSELEKKISRAEGELETKLEGLPETERSELPVYDHLKRYHDEIRYTQQMIRGFEAETEGFRSQLDAIEGDIRKYEMQVGYYNHFIQAEQVDDSGVQALEIREFSKYEAEFSSKKRAIEDLRSKWVQRIRMVQEEAQAFIIREPLDELTRIVPPETASQCGAWRESFREYILNIEEQMQKINNDILQLECYQQDFTRRCVQRAELVLGHLRKLEALSRIDVYGRRVNMIGLSLQEFEEKEKHLRMKNHIDSIVRELGEGGTIDRRLVASKLSTKELVAQIADMDKAAVRLYKIESIAENSKFYRWENAIGSEGQNNSLYFIFAACLISFIRMLTITNTSLKTKKVIIADNPFGATSAVYLWDPMFKIMKQNDIQLIAPGHRIPREITSRFGVSYLLNQDILQDGRMRVVVKDVRVEEDEEYLKYINPEQFSMF